MSRCLLAILFILCFSNAKGRADTTRQAFVKSYPDYSFIWPFIRQRSLQFNVQNRNGRSDVLNFRPNNSFSMGLGLYVFDVVVELGAAVPIDEKSRNRFGDSDTRDLRANIIGKNWGFDFFTQKFSSFYLANPSQTIGANEPFPLRPDISLQNFGVNGIYAFNKKKFSLRSSYNYAERQLKSGGSVMLAGIFSSARLASDSVVLSQQLQTRLGVDDTFSNLRYTTLSLAPGYSYNLIYRSMFVNLTLSVGPAHHWVYYHDGVGAPHYDIAINTFVDSRVAIGYNSDRWFGGVGFISQSREVRFDQFQFTTAASSFKMLVGYRIKERGIFKKRIWDFLPELTARL
ncbi:MAG: DUF4421 family protein [Bacteroidota bacterium]